MKRIVICSDGTWQRPGQAVPTQVTRLARAVLPKAPDGTAQVVFYDAGVGTEGGWLYRVLGGVSGRGLEKNIRDCYRFLVHNYEDGDEIYLFGFSRGAYTVRSLAGLVRNCGVLKNPEAERLPEAYKMYRRTDAAPDSKGPQAFRACYSREAEITFIGVWDTVGALGIPLRGLGKLTAHRHRFHDVELSRYVKHACHALAIGEKRGSFRPSLWEAKPKPGQTVEQVWFPGLHGDIGGTDDPSLGRAPLEWMKERASFAGLSLDQISEDREIYPCAGIGPAGRWERGGNLVYKLWIRLFSHTRKIGCDKTQSVHPAALELYKANPSGAPGNLAAYLNGPEARVYGEEE